MALKSVLRMALPWRDPRSGIFYLRARVPSDLVHVVRGKTVRLPVGEELVPVVVGEAAKVSLRTRDPAAAKALFIAAQAALASHYEALRKGPVHLNKRQVVALAGLIYLEQVEAFGDDPGEADVWRRLRLVQAEAEAAGKLEGWLGGTVDEVLSRQALVIDAPSREALLVEANSALMQQALLMIRHAEGDFRPDPAAERFPDVVQALEPVKVAREGGPSALGGTAGAGTGLSILTVWDRYKATPPLPAISTQRRWEPAIKAFASFIDHKDMAAV